MYTFLRLDISITFFIVWMNVMNEEYNWMEPKISQKYKNYSFLRNIDRFSNIKRNLNDPSPFLLLCYVISHQMECYSLSSRKDEDTNRKIIVAIYFYIMGNLSLSIERVWEKEIFRYFKFYWSSSFNTLFIILLDSNKRKQSDEISIVGFKSVFFWWVWVSDISIQEEKK